MDKKERNSALELLRIVCIFFVLLRHYTTQAGWGTLIGDHYSGNVLLLQLATIGGSSANNVFLMISGYFMIDRPVNYKRVVKLGAEMFFYSWLVALVMFGSGLQPFSLSDAIKAAVPIWFGYNWYVCCYIIFCCFVPFINKMLGALSGEDYRKLLLVTLGIWSVANTLRATTYLGGECTIDHFLAMYLLGGYIRRYGIKANRHSWCFYFVLALAVEMAAATALGLLGAKMGVAKPITWMRTYFNSTNVLDVIMTTTLFLMVLEVKPFVNRGINRVAMSVVGIFLLHHNPLLRTVIWKNLSPNVAYVNSPFLWVHMLGKCAVVFLACLVIDQIRIATVDRWFSGVLDRNWDSFSRGVRERAAAFYTNVRIRI